MRLPPKIITAISTVALLGIIASHAALADPLPWLQDRLEDPWNMQSKVTGYGSRQKPSSCLNNNSLPDTLTMNDVVVLVLCNNPETRVAYLSLLQTADSYGGRFASYLPTITATVAKNRTTTVNNDGTVTSIGKSSGIAAGVILYDFGQREFTIEAAEKSLVAAGYSYEFGLQGTIAAALKSYYDLLTAQNGIEVAQESLRFAKDSFEAAELRKKLGLVPLADTLQAKVAYSSAELGLQQAQNSLSQSQASLAVLIGISPDKPIQVAELDDQHLANDPFGGKVQELMLRAKDKRVDLTAARLGLEAAKLSQRAEKRANLATLSAGVDTGFNHANVFDNDVGRNQSIGISLTIPLFSGFANTYSEQATRKAIEAQEIQLGRTELGIEQEVFNAWNSYEIAKRSWVVSGEQLASATQLKDVAIGRYKEGIGTILDVLSAQSSYRGALQSHLSARLALLTARIELVRAAGILDLETMQPEAEADQPPVPVAQPVSGE